MAQLQQKYDELAEVNRRLQESYHATLVALSHALDLRDQMTQGHSERVTAYSLAIAQSLGLDQDAQEALRLGALLHDIGKIGVSDAILRKPGSLDAREWDEMRQHPIWGKQIIERVDFLARALDVVYAHHEWWDGGGYPQRLRGEQIPLAARIFAVADVFDALTSDRSYKQAWPVEQARAQIIAESGTHFDPRVVNSFVAVFDRILETKGQ